MDIFAALNMAAASNVVFDQLGVTMTVHSILLHSGQTEARRLKEVELAVMDDPLAKNPNIQTAEASWPKGAPDKRKAGSTANKPGTRAWRGSKR